MEVANEHLPDIKPCANAMRFGNHLLYMMKVLIGLCGNSGFAYIGVDVDSRNRQVKRTAFSEIGDKLTLGDADRRMLKLGVLIVISSEDIPIEETLPLGIVK